MAELLIGNPNRGNTSHTPAGGFKVLTTKLKCGTRPVPLRNHYFGEQTESAGDTNGDGT